MIRDEDNSPNARRTHPLLHYPVAPLGAGSRFAMNRTPQFVGKGLSTLAKARYDAQQAADRKKDVANYELAEAREPQVSAALTYVMFQKGQRPLDITKLNPDHPSVRVFKATLEAFLTARAGTKADGTKKGAIVVAQELAADAIPELFKDPATLNAALAGSDWSGQALRWAGNQLFNKAKVAKAEAVPAKA